MDIYMEQQEILVEVKNKKSSWESLKTQDIGISMKDFFRVLTHEEIESITDFTEGELERIEKVKKRSPKKYRTGF